MEQLESIIISEIENHGPMTFDRFMDLALYHSEYGYYAADKSRIGKEGDFYTSPSVHRAFGQVISNFIIKTYGLLDTERLNIIELGAGKGLLCLDILNTIKTDHNDLYKNLKYTIVEYGGKQQYSDSNGLLSEHTDKIDYISDISQLGPGITGIVISNELFDSLPFHRLRYNGDETREIYVTYRNNELTTEFGAISDSRLIDYIQRSGITLFEKQEIEINLRAGSVLKQISSILKCGAVLTIDYGYTAHELFTPDRPRGTFKCHYKHKVNEDPYSNIGKQDITSHVDFSNLIEAGKDYGFNDYIYKDQGQFLVDWGILDIIEATVNSERDEFSGQKERLAIKNLILPQFMGKVFKVLIQYKNTGLLPQAYYPESNLKIV